MLLLRLREALAEPGTAQERLDHITRIIAANMIAEVCSVYVARADTELELFSTHGLKETAVHKTRLRFGQGLVGDIAAGARPLSLWDAQSHPSYVYREETGEEIFHSFLGVPLLRGGRVLGVLAVQNKAKRHYQEEEVEVLQTVAMVLAEMIGSGDLLDAATDADDIAQRARSLRLIGSGLSAGVALGRVVLHEPRVRIEKLVADDVDDEKARMAEAIADLRGAVDGMLSSLHMAAGGEHREILEAYRMFADDQGWLKRLDEAMDTGLTAEAAVEKVQAENRARMDRVSDAYLRERLHDFDDLSNRVLRHLAGEAGTAAHANLPDDAIVIARTMGAAELLDYDRAKLSAVVLEEGSPTSHVAIVARALDLPLVGRLERLRDQVEQGESIVVDGDTGEVVLRPDADVASAFRETLAAREQKLLRYAALKDELPVTRDGRRISLYHNAGLLMDLHHIEETGADGIGLFRTELQFLVSSTLPRLDAQSDHYSRVLDAAGDKPVYFRTLDIGSDKVVPYLQYSDEENPALGWRALRMTLDRPALLRYQIRALLKAAAGRKLSFMFPMVSDVAEFKAARTVLKKETDRLSRLGRVPPVEIRVGSMLEVPALVWQLPALLDQVDFLSIGSNDLSQFLFAADRNNPKLADRYDVLSPAMLSILRDIIRAADAHGVPVSLCGEMAGQPLEAMALVGLGLRTLSMSPAAIGPVKMMIRSLEADKLATYLDILCDLPDRSVREALGTYARENGIAI